MSGTIGQPDVGTLSGGDYVFNGGFWVGAAAPCVVAAPVTTIGKVGDDVRLTWVGTSGISYNIFRAANDPYFIPGSIYAASVTSPWTDPDDNELGEPGYSYYYLVLETDNNCGVTAVTPRVGAFNFGIIPGSSG